MIGAADSIYFLMFPGWKGEFRSNRWHYASRWARHLPVTLVQPMSSSEMVAVSEEEQRIQGCRILSVTGHYFQRWSLPHGLLQTRQLLDDMAERGHRRPILWAYDPNYLVSFSLVPAVLRVYHATENYYNFPDVPKEFLTGLSTMVSIADMVVAVSPGVADSYQSAATVPIDLITNGCDHRFYSGAEPDQGLDAAASDFEKVVVYAGNIDGSPGWPEILRNDLQKGRLSGAIAPDDTDTLPPLDGDRDIIKSRVEFRLRAKRHRHDTKHSELIERGMT